MCCGADVTGEGGQLGYRIPFLGALGHENHSAVVFVFSFLLLDFSEIDDLPTVAGNPTIASVVAAQKRSAKPCSVWPCLWWQCYLGQVILLPQQNFFFLIFFLNTIFFPLLYSMVTQLRIHVHILFSYIIIDRVFSLLKSFPYSIA